MTSEDRQNAGHTDTLVRRWLKSALSAPAAGVVIVALVASLSAPGAARAAGLSVCVHAPGGVTPPAGFCVFAGTAGISGYADGAGVAAQFCGPQGLAFDSSGKLYVADTYNSVIRVVDPAGDVATFAGTPGRSGSGNGARGSATFSFPAGVAVDGQDNVYVCGGDGLIRRIDHTSGQVTTFASGFSAAAAMVFGPGGNLYVTDSQNETVCRVTPDGTVTTIAGESGVAGTTDGCGALAHFDAPRGIACDAAGDLYVTDYYSHLIRRIDHATEAVTTIAGVADTAGYQDGIGSGALFSYPSAITVDASGDLYVTDQGNGCVRRLHYDGSTWQVSTASSLSGFASPVGLAFNAGGELFVTDSTSAVVERGALDRTPPVTTAIGLQQTGNAGWTDEPSVTVTLSVTDNQSGASATYYRVDSSGAYSRYGGPFTISADGSHEVDYYSTDLAGNTETARTGYVNIDTAAPTMTTLKAPGLTVVGARKGRTLKVAVRVTDRQPGCGRASLRVVLTTLGNQKLATLIVAGEPTNKTLTLSDKLTRTLARGTYYLCVTATDAAGNTQARAGKVKLTVK
jgi:streptogramin lyase